MQGAAGKIQRLCCVPERPEDMAPGAWGIDMLHRNKRIPLLIP